MSSRTVGAGVCVTGLLVKLAKQFHLRCQILRPSATVILWHFPGVRALCAITSSNFQLNTLPFAISCPLPLHLVPVPCLHVVVVLSQTLWRPPRSNGVLCIVMPPTGLPLAVSAANTAAHQLEVRQSSGEALLAFAFLLSCVPLLRVLGGCHQSSENPWLSWPCTVKSPCLQRSGTSDKSLSLPWPGTASPHLQRPGTSTRLPSLSWSGTKCPCPVWLGMPSPCPMQRGTKSPCHSRPGTKKSPGRSWPGTTAKTRSL